MGNRSHGMTKDPYGYSLSSGASRARRRRKIRDLGNLAHWLAARGCLFGAECRMRQRASLEAELRG